jgi:AcrR family transcriptional regulator
MQRREPNARGEGEQLRAQLIVAASDLLTTTQKVALPSLRAVARACDVSPAAVYLHFDSLQELIAAVIEAQLDALKLAIQAGQPDAGSPRERLAAFGVSYADWGLTHPGAYQLLFESADRLDLPEHGMDDARWSLIDDGAALVGAAAARTPDEARAIAFRLWSVMHGVVSLRIHKPEVPWPDAGGEIAAMSALLVP